MSGRFPLYNRRKKNKKRKTLCHIIYWQDSPNPSGFRALVSTEREIYLPWLFFSKFRKALIPISCKSNFLHKKGWRTAASNGSKNTMKSNSPIEMGSPYLPTRGDRTRIFCFLLTINRIDSRRRRRKQSIYYISRIQLLNRIVSNWGENTKINGMGKKKKNEEKMNKKKRNGKQLSVWRSRWFKYSPRPGLLFETDDGDNNNSR